MNGPRHIALALVVCGAASAGDAPVERSAHAAAALGDSIYVAGGWGRENGISAALDRFDADTGVWTARAPMEHGRAFHALVVADGAVHAVGGFGRDARCVAPVERYDPRADAWSAVTEMPTPRNRLAAAVMDGRIFTIGGMSADAEGRETNSAVVEIYDPRADRWTRGADMPTRRHAPCAVVLGGRVWVIGGYGDEGETAAAEVYDPARDRWTAMAPMETPRGFFGAIAWEGRIHVFAGRVSGIPPTEVYDPVAGVWRRAPGPRSWRDRFACAAVGSQAYLIGGEDDAGRPPAEGIAVYDAGTERWSGPRVRAAVSTIVR